MAKKSIPKTELLSFLRDFNYNLKLKELAEKLSKHNNYSELAWKNKELSLYTDIEKIAEVFGYTWKYTRALITESYVLSQTEEYQKYLLYKSNPSPESLRLFLDVLAGSPKEKILVKISNRIENYYPEIRKYLSSVTDKECKSIDEQYFALKQPNGLLPKCRYCNTPIHISEDCTEVPVTCGSLECRSKYMKDISSSYSKEKLESMSQKRKATCLSVYGTEAPAQNKEIQEKTRQTNLKRYGTDWTCQAEPIKSKIQQTFLNNYGTTSPMKNEEVKTKMKNTCIKRYGVDNIKKSSRIKEIFLEKYGVENSNLIGKDPEKIEIYKSPEKLKKYFDDNKGKTLKEISESLGFSSYQVGRALHTYGLDEYVGETTGTSIGEKSLVDFVKSLVGEENVIIRDRQTICPLELDILIPNKKIAIEYNGNFWHSDIMLLSRNNKLTETSVKKYHLNKTELCKEKGIHLIHIFEYEWEDTLRKERLKKYLTDILLPESRTKLYARNCIVKEISSKTANDFLDENHLQGKDNSGVRIGLFYNDILVACMTFCKPRFSKKYDWELSRFVVKSGYSVTGGGGKLLNYFRKNYNGSIISYSDIAKMTGNLYRALGFKELEPSEPNYVWIKGNNVLTRYQTQKHKLLKLGFEGDTEEDIMRGRGFLKLYDCGNYVFVKED